MLLLFNMNYKKTFYFYKYSKHLKHKQTCKYMKRIIMEDMI